MSRHVAHDDSEAKAAIVPIPDDRYLDRSCKSLNPHGKKDVSHLTVQPQLPISQHPAMQTQVVFDVGM